MLVFNEYNTGARAQNAVIQFKRGSKAVVVEEATAAVVDDEEKVQADASGSIGEDNSQTQAQAEARKALAEQPKMNNVFSWQNIKYVVTVSDGEKRQLLDNVSGYVAPGKLTALMGESGAGKVCTTFCVVLCPA
jgi:ATP-binding cassette subfamily G (WHITE) protein 2 (SNQ2)